MEMGKKQVEDYLPHLAVNRGVSPSTQNQALQALLFPYRFVLEVELPWLEDVVRAKPRRRIPVVLSPAEAGRPLGEMNGSTALVAELMYGSGLRVSEALGLRVGDVVQHGALGAMSPLDHTELRRWISYPYRAT